MNNSNLNKQRLGNKEHSTPNSLTKRKLQEKTMAEASYSILRQVQKLPNYELFNIVTYLSEKS